MKAMRFLAVTVAILSMLVTPAPAQEKAKPHEPEKPVTSLVVQVVFNEYEGEKKINSLPYTMLVSTGNWTNLRMGLRVPITTGEKAGQAGPFTYQDVGTNIDCRAEPFEGERFKVELRSERSTLYNPGAQKKTDEWTLASQPIFSRFSTSLELLMRDGQTIQSTVATDPVSGRLLKMDVTLHVVKQ